MSAFSVHKRHRSRIVPEPLLLGAKLLLPLWPTSPISPTDSGKWFPFMQASDFFCDSPPGTPLSSALAAHFLVFLRPL